jgi:hypothetical protein
MTPGDPTPVSLYYSSFVPLFSSLPVSPTSSSFSFQSKGSAFSLKSTRVSSSEVI